MRFKEGAAEFLSENAGSGYAEIEKDNYIVSVTRSDLIDWYYTIVLSKDVLYGKLNRFQTAVFLSLALCLSAGILMSLFFTRKNFFPVLDLIKLFSGTSFEKIYDNFINDYEILE